MGFPSYPMATLQVKACLRSHGFQTLNFQVYLFEISEQICRDVTKQTMSLQVYEMVIVLIFYNQWVSIAKQV